MEYNKEFKDSKRIKDLNIRLLICQLKTDIEDLLEGYNSVAREKYDIEIEVDININVKVK